LNKKKVLSVVVTLGLVLSISNTTFATGLSTLLNQKAVQQQQINNDKNDLTKSKSDAQVLGTKIEMMDSQIETQMRTSEDNKKQVEATQNQIMDTEKEIEKAEIEIKSEQALFDKRMRVMYINGTGGYIGVLLDSKNFGDFYLRMETLKKVLEYDTKVINDLKDKKEVVNNKKNTLVKKNTELLALKADNERKLSKLADAKKAENILVAKFESDQNSINARINSANQNLASISKKIDNYSRGVSIASTIRSNTSSSVSAPAVAYSGNDAVVSYAYQFIGIPYVWGGKSPNPGFDCSGFMHYVYAHFGIGIGGDTYSQINDGSPVSKDQLQSGDLVFFGSASSPHHVGMYIGGGQFIEAPHTGAFVRVATLAGRSDFCVARRIK